MDLDFESDSSELIFEKVKMVGERKGTLSILGCSLYQNDNDNYNNITLRQSIFKIYKQKSLKEAESFEGKS